jgi:hypothetical protein
MKIYLRVMQYQLFYIKYAVALLFCLAVDNIIREFRSVNAEVFYETIIIEREECIDKVTGGEQEFIAGQDFCGEQECVKERIAAAEGDLEERVVGVKTSDSIVKARYGVLSYDVLFWNLENFFDLLPDTLEGGRDFTPRGRMRWTRERFDKKSRMVAKVISDATGGSLPMIIGVAEVENRYVLNSLVYDTPLLYGTYGVVHRDSPDRRGIDVALLFREELFRPLKVEVFEVRMPDLGEEYVSRDILYVKGVVQELDTLHLFVNHWPSRYGGERASRYRREHAACVLGERCDSLLKKNYRANIIVMGDFNDPADKLSNETLVELYAPAPIFGDEVSGSIKYKGRWELFDYFLLSDNLRDTLEPISVKEECFRVFSAPYLLERDNKYTGKRPKRTYLGPRYNRGVSDHLPVVLKINRNW